MEKILHCLCAAFGMAAWLAVNGCWIELPLLVSVMPESWNLASHMSIIIQAANIGPLVITVLDVYCRNRLKLKPLIYALLSIGLVSQFLMFFFWDSTVEIKGSDYSIPFFVLFFAASLVDCTSSVSFIPFMMNLQARFLQTYFLGEGLSGFLPSIIGIIQGVGKTTCNGTEPHYHEPNFGIGTFWIIMSSLMLISLISFVAMNLKFKKYFVKYESSTISDSVASSELTANREEGVLSDDSSKCSFDHSAPVLPVTSSSGDMKSYYLLYFMLFVSCFFSNGFLTAIATYISMPYGSQAYHLSAILMTLANPIACLIATFRPLKSERGIILSIFISLALAGYQLFLALGSPCPVLVDTTLGSTLMIMSTTSFMFFTTLAKVSFADVLRNKATSRHLLWYGSITQIGSFCGAIVCYPLVNTLQIFTPRYDCQPCF